MPLSYRKRSLDTEAFGSTSARADSRVDLGLGFYPLDQRFYHDVNRALDRPLQDRRVADQFPPLSSSQVLRSQPKGNSYDEAHWVSCHLDTPT